MEKVLRNSSGNRKENFNKYLKFIKFVKTKKDKRFLVLLEGIKIFNEGEEIGGIWIAINNGKNFRDGDIMAHINTGFGYSRRINADEKFSIIKDVFEELIKEYNTHISTNSN